MSFRRYEITLPTRYNDGSPVEPEKYLITRRDIPARFGALTFFPQPILGEWTYQQVRYEDTNIRIIVDVEDTPQNSSSLSTLSKFSRNDFEWRRGERLVACLSGNVGRRTLDHTH
jgi:hypothetical protein